MAFNVGRGKLAVGILSLAIVAVLLGAWSVQSTGSLTGLFTGSAQTQTLTTVKVGYIPITQALPLFIASQEHLYEKHGVKVELVRFEAPNQLMDALAAGQVSYSGYTAATGIASIVQDKQPGTVAYAGFSCNDGTVHANNALLVKNGGPLATLTTLKELEGKKVGKLPGIQWTTIIHALLAKNGVDASKVELVDLAVPLQLQALASGSVDALVALEPVQTIGVSKGIAKVAIQEPMSNLLLSPFCPGASVINVKFAREHPELAKAVVDATDEAALEINADVSKRQGLTLFTTLDNATALKVPMSEFISLKAVTPTQLDAVQQFVNLFYQGNVTKTRVQVRAMIATLPS